MKQKIQNLFQKLDGDMRLLKQRKNTHDSGIINVVFLAQYVPAWNKFEAIYKRMLMDNKFNPYIVCLPSDINDEEVTVNKRNDIYDYFVSQGYNAINALEEDGTWYQLQQLNPHYIFYTRPYNLHLPKEYKSKIVSRYSNVCNLLYAMNLSKDNIPAMMNLDFFKDTKIFFADNEYTKSFFNKMFPISTSLGIRKVFFEGSPALEQVIQDKEKETNEWDFYKSDYKIIWTPRWTTDVSSGGSNFFTYYQELIQYAKEHTQISLMSRPHPLMFENFILTGEMTLEEVNNYKETINSIDNMVLNESKEYDAILWNSDIMISDISGIMPEYFVTGKPLIFCSSNMKLELIGYAKRMIEGCYVVETKEEMFDCLNNLIHGIDPLKEKRLEIIDEIFGKDLGQVSSRIVQRLKS